MGAPLKNKIHYGETEKVNNSKIKTYGFDIQRRSTAVKDQVKIMGIPALPFSSCFLCVSVPPWWIFRYAA